jgi:hypothetical protein
MSLWNIFRKTFSKSLPVVDKRLIRHKCWGNFGSLPGCLLLATGSHYKTRHRPHRKHQFQNVSDCCMCIYCLAMDWILITGLQLLTSNRCLSNHVTIYATVNNSVDCGSVAPYYKIHTLTHIHILPLAIGCHASLPMSV